MERLTKKGYVLLSAKPEDTVTLMNNIAANDVLHYEHVFNEGNVIDVMKSSGISSGASPKATRPSAEADLSPRTRENRLYCPGCPIKMTPPSSLPGRFQNRMIYHHSQR